MRILTRIRLFSSELKVDHTLSITVLILLSCVWQEDNRIFPKLASISVKNRNKYQDIPFCHNVFFILMETSIIVTVYKQDRMNHLFAT